MRHRRRGHFHIGHNPDVTFYKPKGIPMRSLEVVQLSQEEFEAMRLKNVLGLDQTEAAEIMKTSQSTFQRILSLANKKVSTALVEGKAIEIEQN